MNDYFNESANNISFFFEEHAFDEQGTLRQPKAFSINKMGHGTDMPLQICFDHSNNCLARIASHSVVCTITSS